LIQLVRALAVVLYLLPSSLAAAPEPPHRESGRSVYIVQLDGAPLARLGTSSAEGPRKLDLSSLESLRAAERLRLRQEETLASIGMALGREMQPLHRYSVAFNGLALEITGEEAAALARVAGVRRVQPSARYHISSDAGPSWIGAPGIWNGTATGGLPGTQGEGMIIGVIDTGISLGHPSFADIGGDGYDHVNPRDAGNYVGWCSPSNPDYDPSLACNDKLIGVWSYPEAGGNPRDDNGHGSHTASIAAGNWGTITIPGATLTRLISGVAPHANLIAYDACDSSGACPGSTLLAAVDQAVADGVDVLNLSLSTSAGSPWHDPLTLALLEARSAGIFVAAALQDNDEIGSPGNAPWVLAVGASTHDRRFTSSLVATSGGSPPLPTLTGRSWTASYGPAAVVRAWDHGGFDCSTPFPPGTFAGQIVVCATTISPVPVSPDQKGQNVLAGGAGGMILMNPRQDSLASVLPWISLIGDATNQFWNWYLTGSGHTARIEGTTASVNAAQGDRLWPGSPSGPGDPYFTPDLLKPDVTAPGQEILAAHTGSGGYRDLSGTSMASAHAAGAAALLMALHPEWAPAEIQSALQTTGAGVLLENGTPADALRVGGGRLNLGAAARAGLVLPVTTADFAAADPWNGGSPRDLNLPGLLENACRPGCGWTRTVQSTLATTSTWNVSVEAPAGVTLSVLPSSFTLGPGGTQSLQITASGPTTLTGWKFGRIVLTETGALAPAAHLTVATNWTPHHLLTIQKSGSGAGTVTSSPGGIDCGIDCSELYPADAWVTVTATPSPGSAFVGWNEYCRYVPRPTCTLDMTSARTLTAYFEVSPPDKLLTNHVPLKDAIQGPVEFGTWRYYFFDVGSGTSELVVDLLDLSGDASLYLRFGAKPGFEQPASCIDHDTTVSTNNRRCVLTDPAAGRWWIGVTNRDENVRIDYTVVAHWGSSDDRELANRSPLSDQLSSSSAGAAWKYYFVDLADGSTDLLVELSNLSADADLYLRHGAKPDRTNHDCASREGWIVPDHCAIPSPAAGRWWIGVNNFATGTIIYQLKASWRTVDTPTDFYTVPPCRVLDTRTAAQPLSVDVPRLIQVAGLCGIPATAQAVAANVTVISGSATGALTLYPGDEGIPATRTIHFTASQTRANSVLLKLGGEGTGNLGAVSTATGPHLVVDVSGYFE
jgi:subtilisin family serine protease